MGKLGRNEIWSTFECWFLSTQFQRIWTAFSVIFSGIPQSTIFGSSKYVRLIPNLAIYDIFGSQKKVKWGIPRYIWDEQLSAVQCALCSRNVKLKYCYEICCEISFYDEVLICSYKTLSFWNVTVLSSFRATPKCRIEFSPYWNCTYFVRTSTQSHVRRSVLVRAIEPLATSVTSATPGSDILQVTPPQAHCGTCQPYVQGSAKVCAIPMCHTHTDTNTLADPCWTPATIEMLRRPQWGLLTYHMCQGRLG